MNITIIWKMRGQKIYPRPHRMWMAGLFWPQILCTGYCNVPLYVVLEVASYGLYSLLVSFIVIVIHLIWIVYVELCHVIFSDFQD